MNKSISTELHIKLLQVKYQLKKYRKPGQNYPKQFKYVVIEANKTLTISEISKITTIPRPVMYNWIGKSKEVKTKEQRKNTETSFNKVALPTVLKAMQNDPLPTGKISLTDTTGLTLTLETSDAVNIGEIIAIYLSKRVA